MCAKHYVSLEGNTHVATWLTPQICIFSYKKKQKDYKTLVQVISVVILMFISNCIKRQDINVNSNEILHVV